MHVERDRSHERTTVQRQRPSAQAAKPTDGRSSNRALAMMMVDRSVGHSQGAGPLDPQIAEQINAARTGGVGLPEPTRIDMEHHLGVDLSSVRVHADSSADLLSRSVRAEAFTTGTDIFFRQGAYNPASTEGRRILGHELTHVVQQTSGAVGGPSRVSHPSDPHEVEAARVGDVIASSPVVTRRVGDDSDIADELS